MRSAQCETRRLQHAVPAVHGSRPAAPQHVGLLLKGSCGPILTYGSAVGSQGDAVAGHKSLRASATSFGQGAETPSLQEHVQYARAKSRMARADPTPFYHPLLPRRSRLVREEVSDPDQREF